MSKKSNKPKTMANLEQNECRWPIGDPRDADFHFCGERQAERSPLLRAALGHGVRAVAAALFASRGPGRAPLVPARRAA